MNRLVMNAGPERIAALAVLGETACWMEKKKKETVLPCICEESKSILLSFSDIYKK